MESADGAGGQADVGDRVVEAVDEPTPFGRGVDGEFAGGEVPNNPWLQVPRRRRGFGPTKPQPAERYKLNGEAPMKCQFCENLATVHLTKIVKASKAKQEIHLCERCARRHNLIPDQSTPHVDLKALLGLLLGPLQQPVPSTAEPVALTCPTCGLKYEQFRAEGRLGCPDDYEAFRSMLEPLLERIHRSQVHAGKLPLAVRRRNHDGELKDLRKQMKAAAKAEKYEDAARLRDLIRRKEATDEPR